MGATAVFDYKKWTAIAPDLATVNEPTASAYFDLATIYLRNDGGGRVMTESLQQTLLLLLTAHLVKLFVTVDGNAPSGLVGPINNASEGSVSVGIDVSSLPKSSAWFNQTQYGIAYWAATAGFRTAVYRPFNRFTPAGGPFGGPFGRRFF